MSPLGGDMDEMDVKRNILLSLPTEELAKVQPLSEEAIDSALKQGREERRAAEACEPPSPSNSRLASPRPRSWHLPRRR